MTYELFPKLLNAPKFGISPEKKFVDKFLKLNKDVKFSRNSNIVHYLILDTRLTGTLDE